MGIGRGYQCLPVYLLFLQVRFYVRRLDRRSRSQTVVSVGTSPPARFLAGVHARETDSRFFAELLFTR